MKLGLFLGALLFSITSLASPSYGPYCPDATSWIISTAEPIENLTEIDASQKIDFDNLKLLVWNVYKGGKPGAYKDLDVLTYRADLALLQEGHLSTEFLNLVCSRQDLNWKMARNLTDSSGINAGVVTAGRQNPAEFTFLESPDTETFTDIHKMTLVSYYDLPDRSEKLLVLNMHGINFVLQSAFENQVNEVAKVIKKHQGPVIYAGDFNTYTSGRTEYLLSKMKSLGLTHAEVRGNEFSGLFVLDHMFYRGFEVTKTEVLNNITSSDHTPLYFELKLK